MYTNKTARVKLCASETSINWEISPELEWLNSPRFAPVWVAWFDTFCIAPAECLHSNIGVKLTDKERNHIRTTAQSTEKWTLWSRSQLLCWCWEGWGWRTGHVLVERVIVLQGLSVTNEWPPRTPAPLFSIVPHSGAPPLCNVKVMCEHTHQHGRKILPVPTAIVCLWRHSPSCSAVPFPFKSFNYFFCILAALSAERYIPLLE